MNATHSRQPDRPPPPLAWLAADRAWAVLPQAVRATLVAVAGLMDERLADGSLAGTIGAADAAAAAGIDPRTWWRHAARLEAAGVLVPIATGLRVDGELLPNRYGIPSKPGALDHLRRRRRMQVMVDRQPHVVPPNAQAPLPFSATTTAHQSHQTTTPARETTTPRDTPPARPPRDRNLSRPLVTTCHYPPPPWVKTEDSLSSENREDKNRSAGASPRRTRNWTSSITPQTLRDDDALLELHAAAAAAGDAAESEAGRFEFFALAEYALREGRNPAALFVHHIRRRRDGLPLWIEQADEDRAAQRLRTRHAKPIDTETAERPPAESQSRRVAETPPPRPPAETPCTHPDALAASRAAFFARPPAKGTPTDEEVLEYLQRRDPSWTLPRLQAAKRLATRPTSGATP